MNRRPSTKFLLLLVLALAFLSMETAARLFWRDVPRDIRPSSTLEFEMAPSIAASPETFIMKPDSDFYFQGTRGRTSAHGLRNPVPEEEKPENTVRIVMIGDEIVFGPGLGMENTWPAQLQQYLSGFSGGRKVEVINAGVPHYNIRRSAGLLVPIVRKYRPDLVVIAISEDDFNIQSLDRLDGLSPAAFAPRPEPSAGHCPAIGGLLLPRGKNAPVRYALSRLSRGYLSAVVFCGGYLNTVDETGPVMPGGLRAAAGLRRLDLVSSTSCQARRVVWDGLKTDLAFIEQAQKQNEKYPFKFAAALYSDYRLRGRAAIRLLETFEAAGLPLLNLSVYRGSEISEKKKFTLGWNPWPNAAAARRDAKLLGTLLIENKLLPEPGGWKKPASGERPYEDLLRVRKKMYWDKVNEQEITDQVERGDFKPKIDFSLPGADGSGQFLYGWWPTKDTAWLESPDTAWVSTEAAAVLARPADADTLHIEGRLLRPAIVATGPAEFKVTFECLPTNNVFRATGDRFDFEIPVPPELKGFKTLEIGLIAEKTFTPDGLGLREDDHSLLSFGITLIELK